MHSENISVNEFKTPFKNNKYEGYTTPSCTSLGTDKIDSRINSKYGDSIDRNYHQKIENVQTSSFMLSKSDVQDYNTNTKKSAVADRYIPIRRNNKISLAFSDVIDEDLLKENQSSDLQPNGSDNFNNRANVISSVNDIGETCNST